MILKNKIITLLSIMALNIPTTGILAQEKTSFTLQDVIPGGDNYFNLIPKRMSGLKWWGDVCIRTGVEEIVSIDTKNGKEKTIITLEELNSALQADDKTKGIKQLRSLMGASMPWGDEKEILLSHDGNIIVYNFEDKTVKSAIKINKGAANIDFCKESMTVAYTVGDNLHIASEKIADKQVNPDINIEKAACGGNDIHDIVYGQAVHRNEFGIYKGTFWSPEGKYLAFYRMDQSMVTDYPQVNTTTRTATLEPDKYPMAGMTSHKVTVGIYNPETGKTVYLDAGDPTDRYFTNISWAPDEENIYVIEVNRDQNYAQLVKYNAETGEKIGVLYEESHPKYVEPQHPLTFLPWDETKFIYQSQRDGFNHLYLFDTKKPRPVTLELIEGMNKYKEYVEVKQLTKGEWLVQDILGFNEAKKEVIIASTEVSPLQTNIYSLNIKSGKRTLIGKEDGNHRAQLSAGGTYIIDNMTSFSVAGETSILPTNGKKGITIFTSSDPMPEKFNMPEITLGTIKAADGKTDLYYRLIKPVNFDPNKKYPAIIYVYGGPHAQMIHNTRFYDARGWDLYMAQKGYVMLTVDSRGSDNRGREFENCTFRQLGVEEMKDQVEGAKMLQSLPYVDANRIGVHGWSFGGFMTTNLMLTYPEIFKVGVAGGPVIDWKYYEVMYGERYMDTPETNPEGYKNSNLNLKAGNLKGRLLIIIGGEDPTCVPQHSYTFLRSCIDAGTHPDFFVYPESGHNMIGTERVHLHEHISRYFDDFLK